MTREYEPRKTANRVVDHKKHQIKPVLELSSRAAWALAFEAQLRSMYVADLIVAIIDSWAEAWEEQLGPTDRRRFLESIPYYLRPDKQAQADKP